MTIRPNSLLRSKPLGRIFFLPLLAIASLSPPCLAERILLGDLSSVVASSLTVSPDGSRFAVVSVDERSGQRRVIVDGKPAEKRYDEIAAGTPFFSPDSKHVVYAARLGHRFFVILDGVESPGYLRARDGWPIAGLMFSPQGNYLAYRARIEGRTHVIVNGHPFGPYNVAIDNKGNRLPGVWDFCFSRGGEFFAYRARIKDKMHLCTGRVPAAAGKLLRSPGYDSIGRDTPVPMPGYGADAFGFIAVTGDKEQAMLWNANKATEQGKAYAVIDRDRIVCPSPYKRLDFVAKKSGEDKQWHAIIAGKEGPGFDAIGDLMFDVAGRDAYLGRSGTSVQLVLQEQPGKKYDGIFHPGTVFSADGAHTTYAARLAGEAMIVHDGIEGRIFDEVDAASITHSADSKHLAYIARNAGSSFVVRDNEPGPAFDQVFGVTFRPKSGEVAYRARRGLERFIVIGGSSTPDASEKGPTLIGPFEDVAPHSPVFSEDGKHAAYAVMQDGRWYVHMDGEKHSANEGVVSRLTFTKDNHLAYVAKYFDRGKVKFAFVADGVRGPLYDAIWMGPGGRLHVEGATAGYFAKSGPLIYREQIFWNKSEPKKQDSIKKAS